MPFLTASGLRHYYRLDGADGRPVVMLSHSLGCDHTLWDLQAEALLPDFRVLRYDTPGHGATDCLSGDATIELLARDALHVADALAIDRFAWCGLSLGGMIGQWLGAHAAERITALVLANTSARLSDPSLMEARRRSVLENGIASIADAVMGRFFTPETLAANSPRAASVRRVLLATHPEGYAGCCAAVRDMDQVWDLRTIAAPAMIVVGTRDVSTPWEGNGEVLAREIPGARVLRLPTAHLSNLEAPQEFNAALRDFLLPVVG